MSNSYNPELGSTAISDPTILIVGAGIGGLTAALALQRRGFRVRVFEQARAVGDVGAGLQVSANGSRVLLDLGLNEQLASVVTGSSGREIRLWSTGQTWSPYEISVQSVERYGAPYWLVHRADLHKALLNGVLTNDAKAVRLQACVAEFKHDGDQVTVTLEDGTRHSGDTLVGADGVHSRVRSGLVPGARAAFTGKMAWRGLAPMSSLPQHMRRMVATNWIGVGRNVITYPVRRGTLLNFVGIVERSDWTVESWTSHGSIDECRADFPGWHEDVQKVIEHLQTPFKWALLSRPPLTRWTFGRVTLLGDAAHPTLPFLGQGAVMAIEDGLVLARALEQHRNDLPLGLNAYERLRGPRTWEIVERSARAAEHFHNPALGEAAAASTFIQTSWQPRAVEERYDWLYSYDATAVSV